MKKSDFEKFLSLQSQDLYSFGFILIPDDLQAGQLAVDAISHFLISHKSELETFFSYKSREIEKHLAKFRVEMLKNIYDIAKKRYSQLKLSLNFEDESSAFYQLDFDEKAVLYLKEKAKFNLDDISIVTNKTNAEVIAYLNSGRFKLIQEIPFVQSVEVVNKV